MKLKRKIILFLILAISVKMGISLTLDVKTRYFEKYKLAAIKAGAIYFLEKNGIKVKEIGEDYSLWLISFSKKFDNDYFYYSFAVVLSSPTAFLYKDEIKKKVISFKIKVNSVDWKYSEDFKSFLKKRLTVVTEKTKREAFIGGKLVSDLVLKWFNYKKDEDKNQKDKKLINRNNK